MRNIRSAYNIRQFFPVLSFETLFSHSCPFLAFYVQSKMLKEAEKRSAVLALLAMVSCHSHLMPSPENVKARGKRQNKGEIIVAFRSIFNEKGSASLENVKCGACLKAKKGERNKKPCSGEEIFTSKHLKGQLEPPR